MIKMIDSIKLFSENIDQIEWSYIEKNYPITQLTVKDYYCFKTSIKNFEFKCDNYGIHLEGSAPKYLNQNNIETLKHHQVGSFIQTLSEAIGFDVSQMTISRLDITDNIEVNNPPKTYKKYLGKCRYFQRVDYSYNGLQYINQTRKHTFYDKKLEQINKKATIPEKYINKNLLRYEYSIMSRRKEHLGNGITVLADLLKSENYITLIDKWNNMFQQIEKISFQPKIDMPYICGMKPKDYYVLLGAKTSGGIEQSIIDIDEWQDMGGITQRVGRTMKNNLNTYQKQYNKLKSKNLIDPMQELINMFELRVAENKRMV